MTCFADNCMYDEFWERLTNQERNITFCMALSMTNQQIANAMVISIKTVERHITHILAKLGDILPFGMKPSRIQAVQIMAIHQGHEHVIQMLRNNSRARAIASMVLAGEDTT